MWTPYPKDPMGFPMALRIKSGRRTKYLTLPHCIMQGKVLPYRWSAQKSIISLKNSIGLASVSMQIIRLGKYKTGLRKGFHLLLERENG